MSVHVQPLLMYVERIHPFYLPVLDSAKAIASVFALVKLIMISYIVPQFRQCIMHGITLFLLHSLFLFCSITLHYLCVAALFYHYFKRLYH